MIVFEQILTNLHEKVLLRMNVTQLKCFWEVVNTGSFSEASENLYISQSAVSKNILALEKELELRLFDRRGRKTSLTHAGLRLAGVFGEIIKNHEIADSLIKAIKEEQRVIESRTIKIAGVPTMGNLGILTAINKYIREKPEVELPLSIMEEDAVILSLQAGECDLAFCSSLKLKPDTYKIRRFSTQRFQVFLSSCNELAGKGQIKLTDLIGQKLIVPEQNSMLWELCVTSCEHAGFEPDIILVTNRPEVAINYTIKSNYLYMGLDLIKPAMLPEACRVLEIVDSPTFDYVFAWKREKQLYGYTKDLLDYLISHSSSTDAII